MIKVDTYNYEAFYLDYLEGNLNAQEIETLDQFLKNHPKCAAEVAGMEDILEFELSKEQIVFEDKSSLIEPVLKNVVQLNNVENWMIGSVEGLLSEKENKKLINFVQDHELDPTFNLYKKIKLFPNLKIVFENKKSLLKKNTIVFTMFTRIISLAAVLTLVFLAVNWNNKQNKNQQYSVRENLSNYIPFNAIDEEIIQQSETKLESNYSNSKNKVQQSSKKANQSNLISPLENLKPLPELANNYYPNIAAVKPIPELASYDEFFTIDDFAMFEFNNVNADPNTHQIYAHNEASKLTIQTKYQPVTNALSNITKLPVSYQESTKDSDYKVTKFKIGKISFERKKKK